MKNNHNLLMKMKNLEKFSGAIKRCVAIAMASMLFATTGFSLDTHPVKAQEVSSSADKIEVPETSKDAFKKYEKISGIGEDTILGADFTYYQQCVNPKNPEWKKTYKDYMSQPLDDIFEYVQEQGINTITLKVAVDPTENDNYLSLNEAMKTLKAVKQSKAKIKTNLVLLYSDSMTYANKQSLPNGWTKEDAVKEAQDYTTEVIAKLKAEDIAPSIITIGNEVNCNFLDIKKEWESFVGMASIAEIIKKNDIKVALSLSKPENLQWLIEQFGYAKVDYDYLGVNLYPDDETNSYVENLKKIVEQNASKVQFFVSGVQYDRVNDKNTANVYTQADSVYKLLSATIDEKNAGGLIYTDAAYAGSWKSFFDDEGDAQVSMAIFAYAQGNQPDTSRDPYKYGDDTGLKQQKVTIKKVQNMSDSTIRGIDISSYTALKKAGVKYYDNEGKEASLLKVLSDNGVNYIRIRIWNDPYNEKGETYGGGSNDVKAGLEIAKEAAKYNIKVLLGFHYSDFWADPAVQLLPKDWKKDKDNQEKMCLNVYEFTKETLEQFKDAGADIGMVQVGNEISQGMMGIMHKTKANVWQEEEKSTIIDSYLSAGARAVRECTPDALVAIHLDNLNLGMYKDAMNAWERDNVDYDVLGASSYAFWAGKNMLENVRKAGEYVASRGKLFAVLETSWLNSQKDADGTVNMANNTNGAVYKVGPQGQADMLSDLYNAILSNDNGLGAFYWEGAWIPVRAGWVNWKYNKEMANEFGTGWAAENAEGYYPTSKLYYNENPVWGGNSWDNQTLFDDKGYPLDSLRFYRDAISSNTKYSRVVVALCDKNNNVLEYRVVKVVPGKSITYTLPDIKGYTKEKNTIEISGTNSQLSQVSAIYNKNIENQIITVKKASYKVSYGTTYNLKKEVKAAGDLTFTSSNKKIISVGSKSGKLIVKKPGKVKIKITAGATADYKQTSRIVTIYAVPKKQTIKKVSTAKRKVKVNIKKDVKATGYQIVAAKNSRFSKGKKVLTKKGTRQVTYTITKLNSRKIYYVKARAYKTIGNKKYFGPWSKVKKIRIK
ncbi:MAG TPA: glycosyl hydrolase 53 family protein [Anaerobutyricum hallii]|uniref:glycosyl hydrolase 53 family protein n=1 Tax=Anaerobutyricum hallii TaxID=39488 RepID=UPI00243163AC|nr:glycosyl hydrolase 53 family protein [Anaerobutyricum hallii]HJH96990.1 glycosyl hydrolase 53 family protein [Anaerobutyricum hallii]